MLRVDADEWRAEMPQIAGVVREVRRQGPGHAVDRAGRPQGPARRRLTPPAPVRRWPRARTGAGRAADDQRRREQHSARRPAGVAQCVEQQPGRLGPDLVVLDPHRRQRGAHLVHERHVVEADHAHVLRAGQPACGQRVVAPRARPGRARRRPLSPRCPVEQLTRSARAPSASVQASQVTSRSRVLGQPAVAHPLQVAAAADQAGREVLRPGDVGDAQVARAPPGAPPPSRCRRRCRR